MPADTDVTEISRTVGDDQVVVETVLSFAHDRELVGYLPGVPPTGQWVQIPIVVVMRFDGDKVAHEHLYWDPAALLVQIGLLDPKGLPVGNHDQARYLLDESLRAATSAEVVAPG